MRKTCGNLVKSARKTARTTCARLSTVLHVAHPQHQKLRGKGLVIPEVTASLSANFSTAVFASFTDTTSQFSTLSPVPITTTTKERKVKN